jgi:uncharacterized iron-regulated membrane protein
MGLCAALFLALLGITGGLMVFENEIDRALNPKLTWIQPGDHYLSLTEIQTRLERGYPGYTVAGLAFSPRKDMAWDAFLQSKTSRRGTGIAFNPFTGDILGDEAERNDSMNKVHQLHLRLLAGNAGATIVSVAAVLLLFLSISGIVLWWRRKIFAPDWRNPPKKLNFDVHQALGIYSSFFLMVFSVTAMVIHWEGKATFIADRLTHSPEPPPFPPAQRRVPGAIALSPDRLLAIAEGSVPGAQATMMQLADSPIRIAIKYPEDRTPAGRTNVFIDPYTGKVVHLLSSRAGPLGFRIVKLWNREIHTGDIGGLPTRILACLISLSLPLLTLTGPLIWWNRRTKRKSQLPIANCQLRTVAFKSQ